MSDFRTLYTRYLRTMTILSTLLAGVALLTNLLNRDVPNFIGLGGFVIVNIIWLMLLDRGRVLTASYGLLASLLFIVLISPFGERLVVASVLVLVTAALVTRTEIFVGINVLVFGKLIISALPLLGVTGSSEIPPDLSRVGGALIILAFVSIVTRYFRNGTQRALAATSASVELLQTVSDVTQPLAQILDRDALLERAVTLVQTRFGHYHVQVFLVNDSRDQALLVASTGEVGRQLLDRGHQLSVGSQSVIGQVILRGVAVLVNDTGHEATHYHNELLPNTRAELALPLRDGGLTIGALDVQSLTPNAFSTPATQALQVLADLLASALRGMRQADRAQQIADLNERLKLEAAANLREVERLNQQLTRLAWQEYQSERRGVTGVTLDRDRVLSSNEWSEPLLRAGQEARVIETLGDGGTVAVPVTLRGEVIGAIEVDAGTESNPETVEMVQAVAQRLALSLENARLYEATLESAAHEERINDIAGRFQSVATVDELMRIALAELGDILGAEHGAIRLGQFTEEYAP